jgi:uncharacterized protein
MKLLVNNLRLPLDSGIEELKQLAAKKIGIKLEEINNFKIARESIDARRKPDVSRVYSVIATIGDYCRIFGDNDVRKVIDTPEEELKSGNKKLHNRPVIIGSGPAGIFAGLVLAQYGYMPLILERGDRVEERTAVVNR